MRIIFNMVMLGLMLGLIGCDGCNGDTDTADTAKVTDTAPEGDTDTDTSGA